MAGFTISDVIERWATDALRPHEGNDRIYGVERDEELIESIRARGVLEALVITSDGIIISGHRRWRSAVAVGLGDVPCRRIDGDDLALRRAVVEFNRQRLKTNEVLAREALELVAVAEWEARRRMEDGQNRGRENRWSTASDAVDQSADGGGGDERGPTSAAAVAETMGKSAKTVENLIAVGRAIEALDSSAAPNAPAQAAELRKVLDERGAAPAAALARKQAASDPGRRKEAVRLLLRGDDASNEPVGEHEVARRLGVGRTLVREWHMIAKITPDDPLVKRAADLIGRGVILDDLGSFLDLPMLKGRIYGLVARERGLVATLPTGKPKRRRKKIETAGPVPAEQAPQIMKPTAKTGGAWAAFIMSVIEFLRMAAEADGEDIWRQWPEASRERVADRMEAMAAELNRLAGKIRAIRLTLVK